MSIVIKLYRIRGALLMVAVGVCLLGAFRLFLPPNGILDSIFSVLPFLGMTGILAVFLLAVLLPKHIRNKMRLS